MKTTSDENISDNIILNRTRCTNYQQFWDGCGSGTASEDFAEPHRVQAGEHDSSHDGGEAVDARCVQGERACTQLEGEEDADQHMYRDARRRGA